MDNNNRYFWCLGLGQSEKNKMHDTLDKQGGKMRSQQGESIEVAPLEVLEEGRGETQEGTKVRGVRLPQQGQDCPSRDIHDLTHIPFQPWCEVCVAGRATDDPHQRHPFQPGGSVAMDEWEPVQLDYTSGKTEGSEAEAKMLHSMVLGFGLWRMHNCGEERTSGQLCGGMGCVSP